MAMALFGSQCRASLSKIPRFKDIINNVRHSGYESSKFLVDVGEVTTKYETTQVPEEWKYVERILPPLLVPEPTKKPEYRSGWKPQGEDFSNNIYFVARTRNHMMPVYLVTSDRGQRRQTVIRHIQGNIWELEKELRPFLEDLIKPKPVRLHINELAGKIVIHGDHVNAVKYWLSERNL